MAILFIEDDEHNRALIGDLLRFNDYEVIDVSGGRQGIEQLQSRVDIDLIVCDWLMPGVTGIHVLAEVKKLASVRKIPFIMLTAYAGSEDRKIAMSLGVDEYLTKPFRVDDLLALIKKYV